MEDRVNYCGSMSVVGCGASGLDLYVTPFIMNHNNLCRGTRLWLIIWKKLGCVKKCYGSTTYVFVKR